MVYPGVSAPYDQNSTTLTTATAYFGTGKNAGQFLGAEETASTWNGQSNSVVTTALNFGQITGIMGADRMALGRDTATGDILDHFPATVGNDMKAHPGKYAFYGIEAAATLTPLPEAYEGYEGAKAAIDVTVGAAHLWWDLAHDH